MMRMGLLPRWSAMILVSPSSIVYNTYLVPVVYCVVTIINNYIPVSLCISRLSVK